MYTILNTIFFLPIIIIFWFGIYRKVFFKQWKFMLISAIAGIIYFFIVDLSATTWKAWEFDYARTLNITIGDSVIEELVWVILVFVTVALIIEIILEKIKNQTKNN